MSPHIMRRLKPEDEEVIRKRTELAAIRGTLAERELGLADVRSQLAAFEGRYLREVVTLYAVLDEWKARICLLRAQHDPSADAQQRADQARAEARRTYEAADAAASKACDFSPTPELKGLFREAAKLIHPDFAVDSEDRARRTRFMADANRAYEAGDAEALQRILDEFHDTSGAILAG